MFANYPSTLANRRLPVTSDWVIDQVNAGNFAVSVQIRQLAVHGLSHFPN